LCAQEDRLFCAPLRAARSRAPGPLFTRCLPPRAGGSLFFVLPPSCQVCSPCFRLCCTFSRPIPDRRGEAEASTPGFQLSLKALLFPLGFLGCESSVNDFFSRFLFLSVAGDRTSIPVLSLSYQIKDSCFHSSYGTSIVVSQARSQAV
jgi:hypothetical protein